MDFHTGNRTDHPATDCGRFERNQDQLVDLAFVGRRSGRKFLSLETLGT